MAEPLAAHSALASRQMAEGARLTSLARQARFIFRGSAEAAGIAGQAFGTSLSSTPCRATCHGTRAALWLGPDEWLLLSPDGEANDIAAALETSLGGTAHALVSVAHRNVGLRIDGAGVDSVLNAGCPLDLHEAAFPVGMCTRTVLGKAEIVLWRKDFREFHIEVWRSFAPYVWDFLIQARALL